MSHQFRDTRLRYFVNNIVPFSRESVHESMGAIWRAREPFGAEEDIYALTFLTMLNAVTDRFSLIDSYFDRGPASMGIELATTLVGELVTVLPQSVRLPGAGIT